MPGLSDKIISEIRAKDLRPVPRWRHQFGNWLKLGLFGAAVVAGSLAVSSTFFLFVDYEWEYEAYAETGIVMHLLHSVPYYWLAILGCFLVAGAVDFSRTRGGYRYRASAVVAVFLATTLVIGTVLFVLGVGEDLDETFERQVPLYSDLVWDRADFWTQPESGLLAGTILYVSDRNDFGIRDFSERQWFIDAAEDAWPSGYYPVVGETVRIMGRRDGEAQFHALQIRPWSGLKAYHACIRQTGALCP